jgi:hypothetical protein
MAAKFDGTFGLGFRRGFGALAVFLALVTVVTEAHAAGSFKLKTTTVSETSGAWHLFVKLELPRAPATAHVPMKFLFTKEAAFERDLVDGHGETPVTNTMVLTNQTPNVESLDVDFADGSGKIFKGTNFDFSLSRDRGYEAGIYKVEVHTSDGINIGSGQRLTLNGDNPVVDRRSITFNAKDPSVKKVAAYGDAGTGVASTSGEDSPTQESSSVAASGSAAPFIPPDAYQKTPEEEVKTRPSGCGCAVAGEKSEGALAGIGIAFGMAIAAARRRRRK